MCAQVKSKQRVADHGEVFTNEREVKAMCDLVKDETESISSRFLEPACGNGNFLAEVLNRKLSTVAIKYQTTYHDEWQYQTLWAVSSLYGIDILEDNAQECRARLLNLVEAHYNTHIATKRRNPAFLHTIGYVLKCNIVWGDALSFKNPVTQKLIILPEWSFIGNLLVHRRDYQFDFLVTGSHQYTLFDEKNEPVNIDKEIKSYKPIHYLKLGAHENL